MRDAVIKKPICIEEIKIRIFYQHKNYNWECVIDIKMNTK